MNKINKNFKIKNINKNTTQKSCSIGVAYKTYKAKPEVKQVKRTIQNKRPQKFEQKKEVDLRSGQEQKPAKKKERIFRSNSNQIKRKPFHPKQQNRRKLSNTKFKKQEDSPRKDVFNKPGDDKLRIIPLGGCEEVGRNMTVFEYKNDIVIIDMGLQFPEEDMPGIDYIIPNTEYLKGKEKNVRAVIFTHGHMDHIGAAPILLERLGNPLIVGSKLTVHMIKGRMEDYKRGSLCRVLKELKVMKPVLSAGNNSVFRI